MVAQPEPGSANRPYARSRGSAHLPLLPSPFTSSSALLLAQLRLARFTFAAMGAPPGPRQGIEQRAGLSTRARSRLGNRTAAASTRRTARRPRRSGRRRGDGVGRDQGGRAAAGELLHELHHLHRARVRHPHPQAKIVDMLLLGLGSCLLCGATVLVLVDGLDGFSCNGCPSCSCRQDGLDGLGCHRARARVERAE